MKWLVLAALLGAVACKQKDVPFKPPSKEDAGGGAADAAAPADAPPPPAMKTATKVVVGDHASCALMTDDTLRCWGRNAEGQLGNGTTTDAPTPVMPKLRGVKDVVMGAAHTCALLDDESVTCWGRINFGKKENLLSPSAVPGVAKAKRLFAVGTASCATVADASLVCWGDIDVRGHLRLSGRADGGRAPTPFEGLDHVVALTANGALREDGSVWFFGADGKPQRTAMTEVIEIASSGDEVCGLRRDGSVACAGPATRCAAAAPKAAAVSKPAPTKAAPTKATKQTATKTGTKTTAKTATKTAPKKTTATKKTTPTKKTTASSTAAKTKGKGTAASPPPAPAARTLPVEVLRLPPAKHLAFDVGLCVVTRSGNLQCLANDACKTDTPWPGLPNVDYVTGNCARLTDGSARCWSVDTKSRLVTAIAGVGGAISVAASSSHGCAVLGDRSVVCWGSNKSGALGRGNTDEQSSKQASTVTFR